MSSTNQVAVVATVCVFIRGMKEEVIERFFN